MKLIEHRYFGQLNLATTDDMEVIWEKNIQGIDTWLWLGKNVEPSTGILDLYAHFLENINEKIKEARKALIAYLKDDGYYINFHIEECGLEDLPNDSADFAAKMTVTNLGLWIDSEKPHITMDFMISPDESDEILCVKFGEEEAVIAIDWES
ncbi:DUF2004 domain-containing protein [Treponema pedis]|uniref:DUF2004 domain-containing protein n=1 Tax=Treponema pedis TaxID=409322 RepID=UPI0004062739|nr:DUF2004 domain-containing protein [Treponema pedis]